MLGQGGQRAEALVALVALDLHPTGGVHPLVTAQIRELRIRLGAHLAGEGLHGAVDVLVLLQARRGSERFPAPDTDDSELRRGRREYAAVDSRGHKIPAKYGSQSKANGVSCDWLLAIK